MKLLVLRPAPGAAQTAARAQAMGFDVSLYPLFAIRPLAWAGPDPATFDALLVTSANAALHGGAGLAAYRQLPVFAVGQASAAALAQAGFAQVMAGDGGVAQALAMMADRGVGHALHLCGADVRPYPPHPFAITRVPVYAAIEAGDSVGLAGHLNSEPVIAVHSPRAGRRLAALVAPPQRARLRLAAISPAALEAAGGGWMDGRAASAPSDNAVLALAATLCD